MKLEPRLLAAIDLGSNSFRLLIARAETAGASALVQPVDSLRKSVRLAAGLDADRRLDSESRSRGLAVLSLFSQRLRAYSPQSVRAVATNTLRVARNAADFLADAEAVLGYPIEVISGNEEARLIWVGVSHAIRSEERKLIIDIGGGSTECIVGDSGKPLMLDSIDVGCVSATLAHCPQGVISQIAFEHARRMLRQRFASAARSARALGFERAIGTSGTAKALHHIARDFLGAKALDRPALAAMQAALFGADVATTAPFNTLKPDRRGVITGGLLVMSAVFDAFELERIEYSDAALRDGILVELSAAIDGTDIREQSVSHAVQRLGLDADRCSRMSRRALALYDQAARAVREERLERRALLDWATRLSECGRLVANDSFHRHSAYMLRHMSLPGFSHPEQQILANLALGQTGGLRKLRGLFADDLGWISVLALRLTRLIEAGSVTHAEPPLPALFFKHGEARIEIDARWLEANPNVRFSLLEETTRWTEAQLLSRFDLKEL